MAVKDTTLRKNLNREDFLEAVRLHRIQPNFYLSSAYIVLSGLMIHADNGWMWLQDGDWTVFPPFPFARKPGPLPQTIAKIWCDLHEYPYIFGGFKKQFLDWEYLYDPKDFDNMTGGHWQTFRKNSRKWPKSSKSWSYDNRRGSIKELYHLVADWIEARQSDVKDVDFLLKYIFCDLPSVQRKFIYDGAGSLMAVNAWDENWQFINYRWCIVRSDQPFLDEFARWLFYTDPDIRRRHKWINDGGTLDNPGLERFKDKLNPIIRRARFSWIKKT